MDVVKTILAGLFVEKSRIGPMQVRLINLLLFIAGILTIVLMILNHAAAKPILITIISFIVYLGLLYSGTKGLQLARLSYRQKLYKVWDWSKSLQKYDDYERDSSEFIKINWQWLHPTRVAAETEIARIGNPLGEIKNIGVEAQHNFKTRNPWITDLNAFRAGQIITWPVPEQSVQHTRYKTSLRILEIAKNTFDYSSAPTIRFENERYADGNMSFTAVHIENLEAQPFYDTQIETATQVFKDNFKPEPGQTWQVVARGDGTIRIQQTQDTTTDPVETAVYAAPLPRPNMFAPTTRVAPNPDHAADTDSADTPTSAPARTVIPPRPTAPNQPTAPGRKAFPGANKNDFSL